MIKSSRSSITWGRCNEITQPWLVLSNYLETSLVIEQLQKESGWWGLELPESDGYDLYLWRIGIKSPTGIVGNEASGEVDDREERFDSIGACRVVDW